MLGVGGLVAIALIIDGIGFDRIVETMRPAMRWVPVICVLEVGRFVSETAGAYFAFGSRAKEIPLLTLFRANLIGQSIANLAPAPRLVNETIKITLLAPYVGVPAATSVGATIQAATLLSVGLFSFPCAIAIFSLSGASVWFWAVVIHGIVLVATGLAIRGMTRAKGPGRWLAKRFPRLAPGTAEFAAHAEEVGLWATLPTVSLLGNRLFQAIQIGVAAFAVGIDTDIVRGMAAQGVNLVANAVGVIVPAGLGTTDGAFTLAAEMLKTDTAKAASLALLMRCTQLVWLFIGSGVLFFGPKRSGLPRARVSSR